MLTIVTVKVEAVLYPNNYAFMSMYKKTYFYDYFYCRINRSAEKVSYFTNFTLFSLSMWWNVKWIIRFICFSWISWLLLQQLELFMDFVYSC